MYRFYVQRLMVSAVLVSQALSVACSGPPVKAPSRIPGVLLVADPKLEQKTEIRKSRIPGAGNGVFSRVAIKKGETIGEYGGRMLKKKNRPADNVYVMRVPECARKGDKPYVVIDGRHSRSHMTRVNFAPSQINGVKTHLQNTTIRSLCKKPFVIFVASRDIGAGEELLTSYGEFYAYHHFMKDKAVQSYFCGQIKIDCSKKFTFKH